MPSRAAFDLFRSRCTSYPGNAIIIPADMKDILTSRTASRIRPHLPRVGTRSNGWFQILSTSSENPGGAS
eukprot:2273637-Pyramimonas_sp.AAC.1